MSVLQLNIKLAEHVTFNLIWGKNFSRCDIKKIQAGGGGIGNLPVFICVLRSMISEIMGLNPTHSMKFGCIFMYSSQKTAIFMDVPFVFKNSLRVTFYFAGKIWSLNFKLNDCTMTFTHNSSGEKMCRRNSI